MARYTEPEKHLTLDELNQQTYNNYLYKLSPEHGYNIPAYPRPELHVTHVSHSTDLEALEGIRADGGFRDPIDRTPKVVWFRLTVTPDDLRDAEARTMEIVKPGGVEEEFRPMRAYGGQPRDKEFLSKFASSPAFLSSSRYGSYRFTFDLRDVLDKYSEQFCGGRSPVMRRWKTQLYKQEVMYAVLVHSPHQNKKFKRFPRLEKTPDNICAFRDGPKPYFLWRPQAMCGTHRFKLLDSGDTVSIPKEFFVWDHVALALVVDDQVLQFSGNKLQKSLRFCERGKRQVRHDVTFEPYGTANKVVHELWPYSKALQRFDLSHLHIL
ncbi:uncharacterized protein LOC117381759 [Periophthalmus magnuspinnatus]|uniref:uncharacterized protein LOC117381759 n=1 Tax=Periophthalmus magnuspinnatus TaxID=409849 RepID=UPI00145BB195|nr:uncharacterized protein LOC117381759 [Periophthalmus magnuspinnatus]